MVRIPGGTFTMGSDDHYPEEAPPQPVHVEGFWMDRHPVTNAEFATFVEATGYETVAERDPGDEAGPASARPPGSAVFSSPDGPVDLRDPRSWWECVPGANWRHPEGPDSDVEDRPYHPVVHVTYEDAVAYAEWAGKRLPTEAEWERAARGGLEQAEFVWGDELAPDGEPMANTWQGTFPWRNREVDGYERTSPVEAFPANGYGLYDVAGNVWEWTADQFTPGDDGPTTAACCVPWALYRGASEDPEGADRVLRVLKGGSYLCAPDHCARYRPAARLPLPDDTSASHVGFRCVAREER